MKGQNHLTAILQHTNSNGFTFCSQKLYFKSTLHNGQRVSWAKWAKMHLTWK